MPIKFRCKYCNQLMGIARRKAGMDVGCPTCNGVLRVPFTDSDEPPMPAPIPVLVPVQHQPVFERSDFDAYLQADLNARQAATASPPAAPAAPLPGTVWKPLAPNLGAEKQAVLAPAAPLPGIMLTNGLATLLTIGVIFLMALSFSLGLLVGRAL